MSQKKVIPKKATPPKKKPKLPKVLELRIRLLVRWPEPDADGRWAFTAALPRQGVPAFTIKAKTAKEAWLAVRLNDLDAVEVRQFTVTWTNNGAVPRPTTKENA